MKLIGWAIALAAAGLTPAAAATAPAAAAPAAASAAAAPAEAKPAAGPAIQLTPVNQLPADAVGMPTGGKGIHEQVTPIGKEAAAFHNNWLLLLCAVISGFVLILLTFAILKFRRGANPTPSRNSHNTLLEVVWTLVPVLILVGIAIPSIRLLRHQYTPPPADLTVKVIGNQWFWSYEYPDHGVQFDSNLLKEQKDVKAGERFRTDADGPPLLAVDERLVLPAGKVVKFIVTSNDVIHSFGVPAFWTKMDANPGQLNETWVKVDKPGVYFGVCYELCGARHGYMPIAVEVMPEAKFAAWVAAKGGTMPGAKPAAASDSTGASPVTTPAVPAAAAPQPAAGAPSGKAAAPESPEVANRATAND